MKVALAGEALGNQRRANDRAMADQQAAVGLVREDEASKASDGKGIGKAGISFL